MTSQYEMQFPFTTQREILDYEARYINGQSEKRQILERNVIDIKENVRARRSHETPGGYLCYDELCLMAEWKHRALPFHIKQNPQELIERVTSEAFSPGDDWEKLRKLTRDHSGLRGVRQSVASVILHLYDRKRYPILDEHALRSVGITEEYVHGPEYPFWQEYVNLCRAKSECYNVSMRTLDRALWKYSASGAVFGDNHPS